MNTSDRDQQIVQAFTASLRGDVPPPDQDPAITSVVEQLIAAREDHAVKNARLEEFRGFELYGATQTAPRHDNDAPPALASSGIAQPSSVDEEKNGGEKAAAEKKAAAAVAKRAANTKAAARTRARAAQKLKDLQDRVKDLEAGASSS